MGNKSITKKRGSRSFFDQEQSVCILKETIRSSLFPLARGKRYLWWTWGSLRQPPSSVNLFMKNPTTKRQRPEDHPSTRSSLLHTDEGGSLTFFSGDPEGVSQFEPGIVRYKLTRTPFHNVTERISTAQNPPIGSGPPHADGGSPMALLMKTMRNN